MPANELSSRPSRYWVTALVALGCLTPPVVYGILLARGATVLPGQARQLLLQPEQAAVLVDIRSGVDFAAGHLEGAVNWPADELLAADGPADVPAAWRERTLLLIDDMGWQSLFAASHLRLAGVPSARNVRGGIQEWIHSVASREGTSVDRWRSRDGNVTGLPFREPVFVEELVSLMAFFLVKPIYTLLALCLIVLLWRETSSDLVAVRWGMLCFFVGENACALNVMGCRESSYLLEYIHSAGMAVCLGFVAYALLDGLDRRVIGVSAMAQRCAAMNLCGQCIKHAEVPCGLRRLFALFILLLIIVAGMLPTADWHDTAYNTTVLGQLYPYGHLRAFQMYENWVCAAAAVLLLTAAFVLVQWPGLPALHRAQVLFAAGAGPLGFGSLRALMGGMYSRGQVWFGFWEEMTELLLVAGICFTLWTFRGQWLPSWYSTVDR